MKIEIWFCFIEIKTLYLFVYKPNTLFTHSKPKPMSDKYQNKYRIPSARLQHWDYGAAASYFVTICTRNRAHFFGEIVENRNIEFPQSKNEMILNDIGKIVEQEWLKSIAMRPDMNLELGNFVVMPNHFHGILIIEKNEFNSVLSRRDAMHRVSTDNTDNTNNTANKFGPQSKNLASIIRGFKSAVTTFCRKTGNIDFSWQTRFHEHIIRSPAEFERIQDYIANNVNRWKEDKFYP